MSDSGIRRHRLAAQEDMHDRLRRLLYEAFYGIEFDAPARSHADRRPRLLLVKPSGRTTRPVGRDTLPPTPIAGETKVDRDRNERAIEAWAAPQLHRLP